jgi:hypothetical protein
LLFGKTGFISARLSLPANRLPLQVSVWPVRALSSGHDYRNCSGGG